MHSLVEVGQEAETVRSEIEQLFVRGLSASTPAQRKNLGALAEEWERLGAGHVSSRLLAALQKADKDARDAWLATGEDWRCETPRERSSGARLCRGAMRITRLLPVRGAMAAVVAVPSSCSASSG